MDLKRGSILTCGKGLQVEVLEGNTSCELSCCGEPMVRLKEKTADSRNEKHVPVIEKIAGGYKVKVGSVPHPMTAEHWIQWIELRVGNKLYREFLEPGAPPEAIFMVSGEGSPIAREYCNVHGLWQESSAVPV